MNNVTDIREALAHYRWFNDTVDITLVYYIFYRLFFIIKGTRAFQMLIGIGLIVLALIASRALEFYTLDWLLHSFWSQIVLAGVILFQPEIRRALAQVGERRLFRSMSPVEGSKYVEETVKAAVSMANKRIGALIVLERDTDLTTIVEMGTELDAKVTKEILVSIFLPYSPIHDGAAIIRGKDYRGRVLSTAHVVVEPFQGSWYTAPCRRRPDRRVRRRRGRGIGGNRRISVVSNGSIEHTLETPELRKTLSDIFVKKKNRKP
jgi:diadenylate cyclase